uniref:Ankyrin repeat domain-containing protein n=1 Tax=Chrysotila carterae TaxID=13221 RepID=A0A7S4BK46_CHRCT|mmetsp:Transcript_9371/g.18362  ORF Transcript_9371/g.18362 Transcript_9371/m.18362 type:complete len:110 (+) Transcript_9371:532-861(+)
MISAPSHSRTTVNPLLEAIEEGDHQRIEQLLTAGADPNDPISESTAHGADTPFLRSLAAGAEDAALILLRYGASITTRNGAGQHPLLLAATHGLTRVVTHLLRLGVRAH